MKTTLGKKVYSVNFIQNLRREIDHKKANNVFIAQKGPQEDDLGTVL